METCPVTLEEFESHECPRIELLEANVNVSYLRLSKPRGAAEVARGPAFGNIHSEKDKQVNTATLASR